MHGIRDYFQQQQKNLEKPTYVHMLAYVSLPFPNKHSHTDTSPAAISLWTVTICPQSGNTSFAQVNVSNYPCAAGQATAPSNPHNVFSFPYPPVPGTWRGGPDSGGPQGHGDPQRELLLQAGWQLPPPAGTFTSWLRAGPWQELFSAVNGPINKELRAFVLPLECQGPLQADRAS